MWAWAGFQCSYICLWLRIQICSSHICPPQSLQRSAAGVSQTAHFQRANSQTTDPDNLGSVIKTKKTPKKPLQYNFRLASASL